MRFAYPWGKERYSFLYTRISKNYRKLRFYLSLSFSRYVRYIHPKSPSFLAAAYRNKKQRPVDFVQLTVHGLHLTSSYPHVTEQWACPCPAQDELLWLTDTELRLSSLGDLLYRPPALLAKQMAATLYSWDIELFPTACRGHVTFCSGLLNLCSICSRRQRPHLLAINGSFILLTLYSSSADPAAVWFVSEVSLVFSIKYPQQNPVKNKKNKSAVIIWIWQNCKQLTLPLPFKQLNGLNNYSYS